SRAELRLDWLEEDFSARARGLVALSGARHGEGGAAVTSGRGGARAPRARARGLIALQGARHGEVGAQLLSGRSDAATLAAQRLAAAFPRRFYLELQRAGDPGDAAPAPLAARVA